MKLNYGTTVQVEIYGPRVLELVSRRSDHARYRVIGFGRRATIRDYRPEALAALDAWLAGQPMDFPDAFSRPAEAVFKVGKRRVRITLAPTVAPPLKQLVIIVGTNQMFCAADTVFARSAALPDGSAATVMLAGKLTKPQTAGQENDEPK